MSQAVQWAPAAPERIAGMLKRLLRTCVDAQHGFEAAAAQVTDPAHAIVLAQYAAQRAAFVTALDDAIEDLGDVPANEGTATATLHRAWIDVREAIGGTDHAVLAECARGEARSMERYEQALHVVPLAELPPEIRTMVADQYEELRAAREHMERLSAQS